MSNNVVVKENKLWFENAEGNQIGTKYHLKKGSLPKITKNLLEIVCCDGLEFKFPKPRTNYKKMIIRLDTMETLYEEQLKTLSASYSNLVQSDCIYMVKNAIYNYKNKLIASDISSFTSCYGNKMVVQHASSVYSLIVDEKCLFKCVEYIHLTMDKIFVVYDGELSIYETSTLNFIAKCAVSKAHSYNIECIYLYDNSPDLINISYYDVNSKFTKRELRPIFNLTNVLELGENVNIERYFTANKKVLFVIKGDIDFANVIILDSKTWTYIYTTSNAFTKFTPANRKTYFAVKEEKTVKLYSEELDLLFECIANDILLSERNKDYFILDNVTLKGIATLTGKILIEPNATEIHETVDCFHYTTVFGNSETAIKDDADFKFSI